MSVDPCSLLSEADVTGVTAGSLSSPPAASRTDDGVLCTYGLTGSSVTRVTVAVLQRQPDEVQAFHDNELHPRDGSPITPVQGIGDAAFFDVSDELWVLSGHRTLVVGVDGPAQPRDLEQALARTALGRLPAR